MVMSMDDAGNSTPLVAGPNDAGVADALPALPACCPPESETFAARLHEQQTLEQIVLRTLADTCTFRIYAKDADGRFVFCNTEMVRSLGASNDDILGKRDFDFFPLSLAESYSRDERHLLETGESILEKEEPTTDPATGAPWWTLTSKVPLKDAEGRIVGLVGIGLDLTERKRLEHELVERNDALLAANAELVRTREQLVQSSKLAALGALVAGIAHELNTPIGNSVLVATTLQEALANLEVKFADRLTRSDLCAFMEESREGIDILIRSLSRAADLVASFKQVAVDRTTAARRAFKLKETVDEILLTLSPALRKTTHRVEVQIPDDLVLDSYPGPFGQVLTSLINNALVHAFDGITEGVIAITAERDGDQGVRIVVSDNGHGIAEAHLGRVFDPFFTTKLGQGGSGLGLSVAYNLVTGILGGDIDVTSQPETGARFVLRLPLVAPHPAVELAASPN